MAFSQEPYQSEDAEKRHQLEVFIAEVLSLTGNQGSGGRGSTSAFPRDEESLEASEQPLPDEEILARYVEHYRCKLSTYRPTISAVIDQPEFQPVSFLNLGLERSSAVCRIAQYCSSETLERILEDMYNNAKRWQNDFPNLYQSSAFNAAEELKITFRMPDSVFRKIFPATDTPRDLLVCIDRLRQPKNVLRLLQLNPLPIGTGFLVGGSYLMTNQHVIPSDEVAQECVAQFSYEDLPQSTSVAEYEFAPDLLFVTSPQLDYTLVQLKPDKATRRTAGYQFGWLDLVETTEGILPSLKPDQIAKLIQMLQNYSYTKDQLADYGLPPKQEENLPRQERDLPGDRVAIIQHPRGRKKEIVLQDNGDVKLTLNNLSYRADTDYGSSGSPVFNQRWQLVALTKKVTLELEPRSIATNSNPSEFQIRSVASVGTRICRVIEDLKKQSINLPKLKSFIQDFVTTAEQLNYPPLPAVARLNEGVSNNQKNGYFNCSSHENLDISISQAITVEAWVAKLDDENGVIFHRADTGYKQWKNGDEKQWINGYWIWWFKGKIRVEVKSEQQYEQWYIVDTKNPAPQDKLWHHVAFTWSKSEKIQIYIDGERQELLQDSPTLLENPVVKINAPVSIGGGLGANLSGVIAEVRLWKTVRSPEQIKETMYRRLTSDYRKERLIGYWQFEEDRASKTYVYNLASLDGGAKVPSVELFTPSPKSKPRFGLELNGTDYIDCGSFAIQNAITFEAWVKPNGRDQFFIAGQGGCWGGQGYSVWWNHGWIQVELQGNQNEIHRRFDVLMPDDKDWHHIAFTWSSNLPNICVYIDGKKFPDQSSFAGPIGSSGMNFCIGRNKAITFYYFKGSIAEVRLWTVARSEEQINDAMNRQLRDDEIKDDHLVGYWRLDEQTGNEAANRAGKGQPGLVHGGTWLQPQYIVEKSQGDFGVALGAMKWLKASECPASLPLPCGLKFNDKDDQVNCGHDPSLNVTNAITVEAWVKHQFGNCLIVSRGCYVDDGYSLCWHDGKIRVMLKSANQTAIVDTKENAPADQLWHHIAFTIAFTWDQDSQEVLTWDQDSQEVLIYVDGRQQDCVVMEGQSRSISHAGRTRTTALFAGSLADLEADLVIGCNTGKEQYYDVTIAEVRLWKVARTQDQIKTNMTCRLSRRDDDWNDLLGYWRLDDGGAGNPQARNLKSDSSHGVIEGAQWFPAPPTSTNLSQAPTSTENSSPLTPSV